MGTPPKLERVPRMEHRMAHSNFATALPKTPAGLCSPLKGCPSPPNDQPRSHATPGIENFKSTLATRVMNPFFGTGHNYPDPAF